VWLDRDRARDIGNLISLCVACHTTIHRTKTSELDFMSRFAPRLGFCIDLAEIPTRRGWKLTAHPVRVVSVSYVGVRQTYDLCVEGPWHNFVANGMVVHNSFNEFSMRYAKATDDFYVPDADDVRTQVGKPGAYSFEPVEPELAEQTREELQAVYDAAYAAYERLVEAGVARELARSAIPVGAYTEFYWTVNARALMNFVSLRAHESAQREIRRYAEAVETFLAEKMPVTHAAFVANNRVAP
jgi:thymidylate synthase (FAD)